MGHTIHVFFPETWGFHIAFVTEDNVVAPLSMKVSLHSWPISECVTHFIYALLVFLSYDNTLSFLLLSNYWGSPLWWFPVFFLSSRRVKWCFPTCLFETSLFIIRPSDFRLIKKLQWRIPGMLLRGSAWNLINRYFIIGSPSLVRHHWLAFWLGDIGCPGHRSVQLHTIYKQRFSVSFGYVRPML